MFSVWNPPKLEGLSGAKSKAAKKAAAAGGGSATGGGYQAPPAGGPVTPPDGGPVSTGTGGGFLDSIPSNYLVIGGVVLIYVFFFKKR